MSVRVSRIVGLAAACALIPGSAAAFGADAFYRVPYHASTPRILYCGSADGRHEAQLRRDEELIRVFTAPEAVCVPPGGRMPPPRQRELWTAALHVAYRHAAPSILISNDGGTLVVLASNYAVTDPGEIALEVMHSDGTHVELRALDLIEALVPGPPRAGVGSPKRQWLDRVHCFDDRAVAVVNAAGELRVVDLRTGAVEARDEYACDAPARVACSKRQRRIELPAPCDAAAPETKAQP